MTAVTECPFCGYLGIGPACCPSNNLYRAFNICRVADILHEGWYFFWYNKMQLHPTPDAAQAALVTLIKEHMR